jgi:hypothetical protein
LSVFIPVVVTIAVVWASVGIDDGLPFLWLRLVMRGLVRLLVLDTVVDYSIYIRDPIR